MSFDAPFTRQNLELYLKELAKDFKKRGRGMHAELILVGGASVIINYSFRESSYDVDASYEYPSLMKESINAVADKFGLPEGWLNDDFKRTSSYSNKILQFSEYYKTFSNVLEVRTVRAEYLVAMKLASGRRYKKDLSDVAGIIYEQKIAQNPLSIDLIDKAVLDLYGDWSRISDYARELLGKILACSDLEGLFAELSDKEKTAKETLRSLTQNYPTAVNRDNVDEVISAALKRKNNR